ncbi:MAG: HAD-IC family P-type ATPase, partial [Oscillospiraceae bacterium]
ILILAAATIISVLMGEATEAVTIIMIVLLNACMGFFQEYRTEKTLQSLKDLSAPMARVYRDGRLCEINAQDVVQGDLIAFEAGDKLAADCICEESVQLACDESMLTGESAPVHKAVKDKLFMGCIVAAGRGEGTAEATGMQTEMGKIATLMEETEEEPTPLQIKLKQLGKFVAIACVVICLAVGFLGYLQGNDFLEMLLTGISLAVAAIPEGLPAIVTITLALSVGRILRKGAVIRKLHAVETLGCAAVICTDKTGTVTQNKMTVKEIYINGKIVDLQNNDLKEVNGINMLKSVLVNCNDCNVDSKNKNLEKALYGDPTETALVRMFFTKVKDVVEFTKRGKRIFEIPFDSTRKMMSVITKEGDSERCYVKGAPEKILDKCNYIYEDSIVKPLT